MDRRTRKQRPHKLRRKKRCVRLERLALPRLMTHKTSWLNIQTIVNDHEPARALHQLTPPAWSKTAQHRRSTRLRGRRQRAIVMWIEERKREHTITRELLPQCANRFDHLMHIDVRKNRKRENEIKLNTAIRNREIANAVRVVLRAVAIEMNKMRARVRVSSLLHHRTIDVD